MATCIRVGITYKRHKFKNGLCKCGVKQVEHLRAVANRRERRKAARKGQDLALGAGTGI